MAVPEIAVWLLAPIVKAPGMVPAVQDIYWAPVAAMVIAVVPPAELAQINAELAPNPVPVKLMVPLFIVEALFKVRLPERA